jgi:hypothetical protein
VPSVMPSLVARAAPEAPTTASQSVRRGPWEHGTYTALVEILVSETAKKYVRAHGGTAYVRAHPHHCCTGSLTLLDITTKVPTDSTDFISVDADDIEVKFRGGPSGQPHQLVIELGGWFRRHPTAFWDGCAIKP